MISRLTGNIAHTDIKYVVIDVNGVGYKVFINSDIFTKIAKVGKGENSITLWTYTAVRENALDLYGFLSLAAATRALRGLPAVEAGPFLDYPMPPRSPLLAPPAARSEGLPPPDLTARPDTARNLTGARQTINRDQYEFLRDKKGMSDAAIRNQYNLGF